MSHAESALDYRIRRAERRARLSNERADRAEADAKQLRAEVRRLRGVIAEVRSRAFQTCEELSRVDTSSGAPIWVRTPFVGITDDELAEPLTALVTAIKGVKTREEKSQERRRQRAEIGGQG